MPSSEAASPRATPLVASETALLVGGIAAITATSWIYLFRMARDMEGMCACAMRMAHGSAGMSIGWTLTMWVVMMVAMMVPTAAPMTLLYARFSRGRGGESGIVLPSSAFLLGYIVAWTAFSIAATALQVVLERSAMMSPMTMMLESRVVGGVVLIGAGLFQWTRLKNACLERCRSPIGFFMTEWREGTVGAFIMGVHHGLSCLGCCWALMLLLFVLGAMNMLWIAALTALVLVEKLAPRGELVARFAGSVLVAGGIYMVGSTLA